MAPRPITAQDVAVLASRGLSDIALPMLQRLPKPDCFTLSALQSKLAKIHRCDEDSAAQAPVPGPSNAAVAPFVRGERCMGGCRHGISRMTCTVQAMLHREEQMASRSGLLTPSHTKQNVGSGKLPKSYGMAKYLLIAERCSLPMCRLTE